MRRGEPIGANLVAHPVFPAMVTQMIGVGEETGALDQMLGRSSKFLEEEIERMVESLTSLLEPMLIVILGGAVGSMVICLVPADVQGRHPDQQRDKWLTLGKTGNGGTPSSSSGPRGRQPKQRAPEQGEPVTVGEPGTQPSVVRRGVCWPVWLQPR